MNNKIVYKISIEINENIMNGACDNHYRICLRHEGVALILLGTFFFFKLTSKVFSTYWFWQEISYNNTDYKSNQYPKNSFYHIIKIYFQKYE